MVTHDSGALHPIWGELRDPDVERAFRQATWGSDRIQGVAVSGLAALIYLAGFWLDWQLPTEAGRVVTSGRVIGALAALLVLQAARSPAPTPAWSRSQVAFSGLAGLCIAYERLAWAEADPLPGGLVTIFIGAIVAIIGFMPLRVRCMLPLSAFLVAVPVAGLVASGTPTVTVFIGGQMLLGAASGMLACSVLFQRERRRSWHTAAQLRAANAHVQSLLDANARTMDALRRQADTDPLTGALNRRGGSGLADVLIARGATVSVLVIDLDHFKRVNDTFGHNGGDEALRHVVRLMRAASEAGDLVVRWGGDEMLLVQADSDVDQGRALAAQLAHLARTTPVCFEGHPFVVTLSIGCATGTGTLARLIEEADAAVYAAKERGRDQAVHAGDIQYHELLTA